MSNIPGLTLIGPVEGWDVHRWPVHTEYRIADELLIPVGPVVRRYDATQAGTLAGELVATGYDGREPAALPSFAKRFGLLTGRQVSPENAPADSMTEWNKIRRHVEIALGYLRDPKRGHYSAADALQHVNDGLREWLALGVSPLPGKSRRYEFGYQHVGLAGVIFAQLAEALAGVVAFRVCKYPACRKPFLIGGTAPAGRRKNAEYCNDNCKVYHYRATHPAPKRPNVQRMKHRGVRHAPR